MEWVVGTCKRWNSKPLSHVFIHVKMVFLGSLLAFQWIFAFFIPLLVFLLCYAIVCDVSSVEVGQRKGHEELCFHLVNLSGNCRIDCVVRKLGWDFWVQLGLGPKGNLGWVCWSWCWIRPNFEINPHEIRVYIR